MTCKIGSKGQHDLGGSAVVTVQRRRPLTATTALPNELLTGRYTLDPKNPCRMILAEAKATLLKYQTHTK